MFRENKGENKEKGEEAEKAEKGKEKEEMTENAENSGLSLENNNAEEEILDRTTQNSGQTLEVVPTDQEIKEKLKNIENQYVRLLADYQNLQKRSAQEKEELYRYAAQKTIEIILPALDTFDYAKSTIKPDSRPEKVIEDLNLVFEMLLKCLKDIGLEAIEEAGVPFDPIYHEPLHQIPTNELPDHTIIQVLKKGYMLNKKVIRPALVSVSVKQDAQQQ